MSPSKIYGLIGSPVKHSLSPLMHHFWFEKASINAEYRLFEVKSQDLHDFLFNRKDVIGFNITIPHKVRAEEILKPNDLEELRQQIRTSREGLIQQDLWYRVLSGAINTVKRDNGDISCYNTDVWGFGKSLDEEFGSSTHYKNVLLIGCGGAGRAVVAQLSLKQRRVNTIYICDISESAIKSAQEHFDRFEFVKNKFKFIPHDQIPEIIQICQLLVNATPVGMKEGDGSPIDKNLLHEGLFVYDVVYNRDTELVQNAKEKCKGAVGGLGMFLYQGAAAFELWTGRKADVKAVKPLLLEAIKKQC